MTYKMIPVNMFIVINEVPITTTFNFIKRGGYIKQTYMKSIVPFCVKEFVERNKV